jgi:PAS domain S-box-containing protein
VLALLAGLVVALAAAVVRYRRLGREATDRRLALEATLAQRDARARALHASEERYRAFLGSSSEGIARFDLEDPMRTDAPPDEQVRHILRSARLSECNEAFVRLLDRPRSESLIGLRLDELIPRVEIGEGLQMFVRRGYALLEREFPRERPDRTPLWMSTSAVGILESRGLTAVWVSRRDVTARKATEEDLRRKGQILEAVAFSSAGFLAPGGWQDRAPAVLEQLGESVEASSAFIFENLPGGTVTSLRQEWVAPGIPPIRDPRVHALDWNTLSYGPWCAAALGTGQPVTLATRDLPPEGMIRQSGFASLLLVPIFVEEKWWGQLAFGQYGNDRRWSAAEMGALRAAANSLGSALAREAKEGALRESEERFRGLAAAAFEAIAITEDGVFVDGNDQLGAMLGCDLAQLRGQKVVKFVAPEDRERVAAHIASGGQEPYAHHALRWDGSAFPVEVRPRELPYKGRKVRVSALLDITDRVRAEEALRSSEKKYRDIFDFAPIGIYQARQDGTLIMANNRFAEMLGRGSILEVLGLDMGRDVYLDAPEPGKLLALHEAGGEFEAAFKKKDGSTLWAQIAGRAIQDAEGGTLYVEGFVRDVSERKTAETERDNLYLQVVRAAAEWQRTFDSVEAVLMILDGEGRILRLNRAGRALLARPYTDILGQRLPDLGSGGLLAKAAEVVDAVRTTRSSVTAQAKDEKGAHTWDLAAGLATLQDTSDVRLILVITDITRTIALQESLRRSETMSALGSLVAGVAHEVRNPLFSISATLDAFDAEFGAREEYRDYATLLRSQVARLTQLMRDLLDYGKPPVTALRTGSLRDAIRRGIRAAASLARDRGVSVKEEPQGSIPNLPLDAGRMEQVFENLVANAIQHSSKGGHVRVVSRVDAVDGSSRVVAAVEDEGKGIPRQEIPRLFEPFFSRRKGGTGLGLSIVQRIVEAHGGTVTAANRAEGGAVFTVVLPVRGGEGGKQGG